MRGFSTSPLAAVLTTGVLALSSASSHAQGPQPAFSLPPLEEFAAIVDRPLFSPERRPPEGASAPAEATAAASDADGDAPHQVVLAGTATDQANRAVAILHDVSQDTQFQVWVGDQVDGWRVKEIRPRTVVFVTGTREITVTLDEPALPPAAEEQ